MPTGSENPTAVERMTREKVLNLCRPTWDETWMNVALAVARSRCSLASIGAVIVDTTQKVQSSGYNGPPPGLKVEGECRFWCSRAISSFENPAARESADYSACESLHAEENALLRADYTKIRGGSIYVSGAVCINCARRIAAAELSYVYHRVGSKDTHRRPDDVEKYLRSVGINVIRIRLP